MQGRLHIWIAGLALLAAAVYITTKAMGGIGFFTAIQTAAVLLPFILVLALGFRPYWIGIMIGLCLWGYQFNVPIFDRLHLRVFWGALILALALGQYIISKDPLPNMYKHPSVRLMLAVAVAIGVRFLYDRPGSARFGGLGGGGQAYTIMAAFLMFPLFIRLAGKEWDVRRNLVLAVAIASALYGRYVFRLAVGGALFRTTMYPPELWFLAPTLFVMALFYQKRRPGSMVTALFVPASISFMLAMALFTPFRSRLWFALGSILVISYVFQRTKRTLRVFVLLAAIGIPLAAVSMPRLPLIMQRSLTTVLPSRFQDYISRHELGEARISSEIGWDIGWRQMLTELAVRDIRQAPWFGRGWAFTFDQIIAVAGTYEALALSGAYHNGLLQITASMGIPVGILFTIAWLWIPARFLFLARRLPIGWPKVLSASLLGWYAATSGQFLMNGSAPDFFNIGVMLGIMVGVTPKFTALAAGEEPAAQTVPEARPVLMPRPAIAPAFSRVSR